VVRGRGWWLNPQPDGRLGEVDLARASAPCFGSALTPTRWRRP
jgi:hypothetical protein